MAGWTAPSRRRMADLGRQARGWLRHLVEKAEEDNIFFLAGAIAFNVIVALLPLMLAVVGIAGTILRLQDADAVQPLTGMILDALPPVSPEFEAMVGQVLEEIMATSPGLLSLGSILLIWLATRLIGTLRTVLGDVFDVGEGRGILAGKLFDARMVLAAGTLFALNVAFTLVVDIVTGFGLGVLGLEAEQLRGWQAIYGRAVAFVSIWVMFLLIYRYLPARRIGWRTALIAASFTAILFELLKLGFSWYVTEVADFRSTYGNLATLFILFLWIYYSAVAFILGGEIAQVAAMRRIRRTQKERLV